VSARFLLDTNILSDLVRNPQGRIYRRIAHVGQAFVCTSIIVAAELRYGAAKKGSQRLAAQIESILGALEVVAFEPPADVRYGELRARLEKQGRIIGANDLLIGAQAILLGAVLVTDNEQEFMHVDDLEIENWLRD
jgi:tRNA(fMet)-specific endonuclease VapC